jgi:cytochrome P450
MKARKKSDDIVLVRFGRSEYYYLVINPALVEEALVTRQANFGKEFYIHVFIPTWKAMHQKLIAGTQFEPHDKQKKRQQAAFHQQMVTSYAKKTTDIGERFLKNWTDKKLIDLSHEMVKVTAIIVAKCLFNLDIESRIDKLGSDLTTFAETYQRLSSPLYLLITKLPSNKKYEDARKRVDSLIAKMIEDRRKSGEDPGDMLSIFLNARNEKGEAMTEGQIHDQVGIFLIVGHETSSACLTWTYYLLSQHPEVEKKLHEEIDSLLPKYETPTSQDVSKLEYTMKVIYESMRLYPPSWSIVRQASKACTLGDYALPERAHLWISQYLNHRDPRFFPEPTKFIPDRWTEDMKKNLPKYAYFPFGGGARRCIGEPFAWMEMALLMAMISRRWRLRHDPRHKVVLSPGITLVPKYGMRMKLEKR